ncbi:hypothetical protein HNP84_009478 [Thermocatellispora tengchongensis]|uniref:Uncharacterized protein n=1 Tax=Thermocatellispora tengchongensis TaxID=1073253 RepID=A0A840PE63_9ACTN|nr:hypothetical protein [Thermocatellispora tengchongensis]MBB5139714.1 hypothetical protein [Thermocatellispora tengchongensis]
MTPQSDEDEVWRQIVASFNEPAETTASGDQPWPDSENLPAEPARRVVKRPDDDAQAPPFGDDAQAPPFGDDGRGVRDGRDGRDGRDAPPEDDDAFAGDERARDAEAADDDDHYVPPPPPPLPKADTSTKIAWLALFGGPAYLLLAALLDWHMQGWALFAAVAAFIGGFVALVVRMGDGPPNDSGWDDGAVV